MMWIYKTTHIISLMVRALGSDLRNSKMYVRRKAWKGIRTVNKITDSQKQVVGVADVGGGGGGGGGEGALYLLN